MRLEVRQAVGHDVVGHVTLELDDEAVVAEPTFGGTALQLGQVDVARGEATEDGVERSGPVGVLEADDGRAIMSRRSRDVLTPDDDEPGDVVGMIFDVGRQRDQAEEASPGERRGDSGPGFR